MIRVECESCRAPYELDERRLPASGLKMRCPKCGTSFLVKPTGVVESASAGLPAVKKTQMGVPIAPPVEPPAAPSPAPSSALPPAPVRKPTTAFGAPSGAARPPIAPPVAGAAQPPMRKPTTAFGGPPPMKQPLPSYEDVTDLPAPRPAAPRPPFAPPPRSAAAPEPPAPAEPMTKPRKGVDYTTQDVDLPTPRHVPPLPMPAAASPPASPPLPAPSDPMMPAPAGPMTKPRKGIDYTTQDVDLPAPRGAALPRPAALAPPPAPAPGGPMTKPRKGVDYTTQDVDLPAPRGAAPFPAPAAPPGPTTLPRKGVDYRTGDVDLPAPRGAPLAPPPRTPAPDLDLPAPRGAPPSRVKVTPPPDLDLPAPRSKRTPAPDVDFPAPRARAEAARPPPDLDLPAPRGRGEVAKPPPDLDLPAPRGGGFGDLDLPAPRGAPETMPRESRRRTGEVLLGELDLPQAAGATDLPAPKADSRGGASFGDLDLPQRRAAPQLPDGGLDLPAPKGDLDLPAPRDPYGGIDLPAPKESIDFPAAAGSLDLPAPRGGGDDGGGIEIDLDVGGGKPASPRAQSFGEIELPAAGDGTEFDALPQRTSGPAPADGSVALPQVAQRGRDKETRERPTAAVASKRRRWPVVLLVLLALVGGGGGALGATPYGLFGSYFAEQYFPEAGTPAARASTFRRADELAAPDTFHDVRESLSALGRARRQTGLDRELLARSIAEEALYQVRFGDDSASSGHIAAMKARLDARGYAGKGMALATAADALRRHDVGAARRALGPARRDAPRDALVDLVAGETALAANAPPEAVERFSAAVAHGGGARAQWGLARSLVLANDPAAAAAIDAVLTQSPRHAGARVAKARLRIAAGDPDGAAVLLREAASLEAVDGAALATSHAERVSALVALGRLEELRGRLGDAERAYEGALTLDARDTGALLGAGRVLLREERTGDAIARFDAVMQSAADGPLDGIPRTVRQEATLYMARGAVMQDRAEDAKRALLELQTALPDDADVLLALGRAEQKLDEKATAEQRFRNAIQLQPTRFDGYLALAQLFQTESRNDEAAATLAAAAEHVPATAEVRRAMGEADLARGAFDDAVSHFGQAVGLDETDEGALFGLGTANRRAGHFDASLDALERLARRDPQYPGLALERGQVLEARGQAAEAAAAYEQALQSRPDDADLLLRLGAAQLSAEKLDDAQHTAERVVNLRPNSAEAEYLLGRVAFARGDTANALQHFDRSVSLDGTKGEFRLYDAWASLESGNLGKAAEQVQTAIDRDPSLGDAYWIRGEVRLRTGAVQDALTDLQRALVLKPGRAEALAAIGECYDQLRARTAAIAAYQRAVGADADNGRWWYRLGEISLDDGRGDAARTALSRAVLLGEAMQVRPAWVADAHRIYGDALKLHGDRALAIEQYRRYLEIAPPGAIDRDDVEHSVAFLQNR